MCVVVIRPCGYDLELAGLRVEIYLTVTPQKLARLKCNLFYKAADFVTVRVEVEPGVLKVIYRVRISVGVFYLFRADAAYYTNAARIDTGKGLLFVVVYYAVFIDVDIYIFFISRKLQTGGSVFARVYVPSAADRKQAGIKFNVRGRVALYRRQPLIIGKR